MLPFGEVAAVGFVEAVFAIRTTVADVLLLVAALHEARVLAGRDVALTRESRLRNLKNISVIQSPILML